VLFARGVILVEGAAEVFIVPAIADSMGLNLDEYGISVCSVHGTHFMPYVKLLGPSGLDIPFVVVTDGDPYIVASSRIRRSRGMNRAMQIYDSVRTTSTDLHALNNDGRWEELRENVEGTGVFVGDRTLEVDLFNSRHGSEMVTALEELGSSTTTLNNMRTILSTGNALTVEGREILLAAIDRPGKGRFAQRLSSSIDEKLCPEYLTAAISHIVEKVSP